MESILEAEGIEKTYGGRTVLDVERLNVAPGEILACLGPSGAGKSVLLRILNLLEHPTRGKVFFKGGRVDHLKGRHRVEVSRRMAMLFQDPLLFNTSVENNVTYGLKIRRLPPEERDRRLRRSLAMVHMEDFRESRGYTLSGGEAQRVALARALVVEPELILLDEPFANLDRLTKKELQEEVRGILRESGLAAVFVTHDQDEAGLMGDRIVILNHGRVVQKGTAREVFFHPSDRFAAHFVGMDNVFEGKVVAQQDGIAGVDVDGARFELMSDLPVGSEVTVGLRPEDVTVVPAGDIDNPASSRNAFAGTVEKVEIGGPTARVTVRCPLPVIALITTRSLEELEITEGSKAGVRFKATAPHVF